MSEATSRKMPRLDLEAAKPEEIERAVAASEPMLHPEEEAALKAARSIGDVLEGARAEMLARAKAREDQARGEGELPAVVTPWESLNRELGGGFWPGLHVLNGTTGAGKSQWALQIAHDAAKKGHPVLYVGLELGDVDLVARLYGLEAGRKWSSLFFGERGSAETLTNQALADAIARLPLHFEEGESYGWSADLLEPRVAALKAFHASQGRTKPILVVLDFLQIVAAPEGERQEVRERIGQAAYRARQVARKHGAVVLALSSVSRDNAKALGKSDDEGQTFGSGDPGRFVGLGKESGEIEYSADTVMVMARTKFDLGGSTMTLGIAKRRAKPEGAGNGWVELTFDGGRFVDPAEGMTWGSA